MQSLTHITLDMQRPNYLAVHAVQGDQLSRFVSASLTDGGAAWTPPSDSLCTIRYKKPDGYGGLYDQLENGDAAYEVSGSVVTFAFAAQVLTTPGVVLVELTFYTEDAERLSAFQFRLEVEKNPITDAEMESSDYYNILAQQIAGVLGATAHPPQIDPTTKNWLLWDENASAYVDSGYSSIGLTGPAPQITSQTNYWQRSDSGTTIPTGEWSSTPLTGQPGKFLWTKSVVAYNNGDTETLYLSAYQGNDGIGAPGNQTPLPDAASGVVGTATAFSREDHQHPLPAASDILTSDDLSVQNHISSIEVDLEAKQLSTYSSVSQLGLTVGSATIAGALEALPNNSVLMCRAQEFDSAQVPSTFGIVRIERSGDPSRSAIMFLGKTSDLLDKRMFLASNNAPSGAWESLVTVVESGTASGTNVSWYYRKWSDGRVEAWGTYSASVAISTASNDYGGYRSAELTIAIPTAIGLNSASYYIIGQKSGSGGSKVNAVYPSSATAAKMYCWSPTSGTSTMPVALYLNGTWR